MEVRSKYESPLVLERIEIAESTFRKKEYLPDDLELGIQVGHQVMRPGIDKYEIILDITVADKDENIYVNVKSRAFFCTGQENGEVLETNMVAIMFPYIRSYITLITTQPGMVPVVLPAMNIMAMINEQKTQL